VSLQSVKQFFVEQAPDLEVIELPTSTATVALAAEGHGVTPAEIAKTLCLRVGDSVLLVVASGTARLDNKKARAVFGGKAKMPGPEEVEMLTSHPIGGVCPFGLPSPIPVYCDISLQNFPEVLPAAGAINAAVRISPNRLVELTHAQWVDVCETAS